MVKVKFEQYDVEAKYKGKVNGRFAWDIEIFENGESVYSENNHMSLYRNVDVMVTAFMESLNDEGPTIVELPIKGLYSINGDDLECGDDNCICGDLFFFNSEMLDNNILIQLATHVIDDDLFHTLEVVHQNDLDTFKHLVYYGEVLMPIMQHVIIKEIYTVYNENSLDKFLEVIDTLSPGYNSASNQKTLKAKKQFKADISHIFSNIKNSIKVVH